MGNGPHNQHRKSDRTWGSAFHAVPLSLKQIASGYVDEKIVLARKLIRDGLTPKEMAEQLGYKSTSGLANYLRSNNLPVPIGSRRPGKVVWDEKRRAAHRAAMQAFHAKGDHQNDWSKIKKQNTKEETMRVSAPKWAEEAQKLKDQNVPVKEIAAKFGVTASRVYQVLQIIHGAAGRNTSNWAEEARRLKKEGKSDEEIAKAVGKGVKRVSYVLDLPRRRREEAIAKARKERDAERKEETAMPDRQFKFIKAIRNEKTGELGNAVVIECGNGDCNKKDHFFRAHGAISHTHAAQVFRNRGWVVGGGPRGDRCPSCLQGLGSHKAPDLPKAKADVEAKLKKPEPPVEATPQARPYGDVTEHKREEALAASVEVPDRSMTREERRIIFAKLNDVYADEETGYRKDWNDAKVSKDLGVPVQWVAQVRDENFGPERNAAEVARQIAKLRETGKGIIAMRDEIAAAHVDLAKRMEDFEAKCAEFAELYKAIA